MSNLVYSPTKTDDDFDDGDPAVHVLEWKVNQVSADLEQLQESIEETDNELTRLRKRQKYLLSEKQKLEAAVALLKGEIY